MLNLNSPQVDEAAFGEVDRTRLVAIAETSQHYVERVVREREDPHPYDMRVRAMDYSHSYYNNISPQRFDSKSGGVTVADMLATADEFLVWLKADDD